MVRALGLREDCYERFLGFFHSKAVDLPTLTELWVALALKLLCSRVLTCNGRILLLADGIKVGKSGRKMPAVKKLHQESQDNSKAEYIFGHSCQAVALVVQAASSYFALPLCWRIHEGVILSNRDKRTLFDKLVSMVLSLGIRVPAYLIADTYYASKAVIEPLLKRGQHLISAVRSNVVAYEPAAPAEIKRRGRPRTYGKKIKLFSLFEQTGLFSQAPSPVYGETDVSIRYLCRDLYWRPVGIKVRFVLVDHPSRGKKIFLCTDLTLDPLEIIRLYGIRFKIELSFKQAVHQIGTYGYHFWMRTMKTARVQNHGTTQRNQKNYAELKKKCVRFSEQNDLISAFCRPLWDATDYDYGCVRKLRIARPRKAGTP
ncbi:MAG: transposase [Opitutales bacterium]